MGVSPSEGVTPAIEPPCLRASNDARKQKVDATLFTRNQNQYDIGKTSSSDLVPDAPVRSEKDSLKRYSLQPMQASNEYSQNTELLNTMHRQSLNLTNINTNTIAIHSPSDAGKPDSSVGCNNPFPIDLVNEGVLDSGSFEAVRGQCSRQSLYPDLAKFSIDTTNNEQICQPRQRNDPTNDLIPSTSTSMDETKVSSGPSISLRKKEEENMKPKPKLEFHEELQERLNKRKSLPFQINGNMYGRQESVVPQSFQIQKSLTGSGTQSYDGSLQSEEGKYNVRSWGTFIGLNLKFI